MKLPRNLVTGTQPIAAIAAFGAFLLAGTATPFAQSATPAPMTSAPMTTAPAAPSSASTPAPMKVPNDAHVESRIKQLHAQLKITQDEESKWSDMAQTMRDNEHSMAALIQKRNAGGKSMNAVDNLKSYQEITDAHADGLKKLVSSFSSLYSAMPDAQKKVADKIFAQRVSPAKKTAIKAPAAPKTNS